jgi:hypothetical protein
VTVPDHVRINVSVEDTHLGQIDEVAAKLRAAGMHVDQTLATIGSISGHATSELLNTLRQVPGVAAIEPERSFQLPPSGADVQ